MSNASIRQPAVAGRFYPGDATKLEAEVQHYLTAARAPDDCLDPPLVKAIIAPHAGYVYSGPIAASAYVHLACSDIPIRRFILIGPAHFVPVRGLAVSGAAAFDTPLGRVPVDEAARAAALALPGVTVDEYAHRPEHCLEVQLPFLQELFLDFSIVPLLAGDTTAEEVAAVLEALWDGPETRIVISSDLSHYHSHANASRLDQETAEAIADLRPEALRGDCACGREAIAGLLLAARRRFLYIADIRRVGGSGAAASYVADDFVTRIDAGGGNAYRIRSSATHRCSSLHSNACAIDGGGITGSICCNNTGECRVFLHAHSHSGFASRILLNTGQQIIAAGCISGITRHNCQLIT